ncbi:GlxA family transcriptional regulator [Kibdelosporangium phytohabitans]|uniref:AraC family transcriptional regulator n=1 Tax=Kibdelosporangium phytohabitans TaxID=860235 RepID=A0A0N7F5C1_9PSEU|nr:helix-turn-helix domain-containing protein [Kibdelosporangium phytohabitans]ALG13815.1 AraC family transcriptional regulator [Kibdelosporangium phytohabitans]MBE1467258.1 transcriptional regulator GlxA family with amidase domain [Kibdelosporangium phytohabitans]
MPVAAILAFDKVVPFDLATPIEVFSRSRTYEVKVCGTATVDAGAFKLQPPWGLDGLAGADTVIVPGCSDVFAPVPDDVCTALRSAADAGARIASICTGAFILAAAGLLDGKRATTHWLAAQVLADRYPAVTVDPNVLYVDNGQVLTSAGAAAGLDLCLHLIRKDYGSAAAADAARLSVMPLEREGGQAQFIVHPQPVVPQGSTMEPLLRWMIDNAGRDLSLEDIAGHARVSARTLNRRFREQLGTSPLQWLHNLRIRQAQALLEATSAPVELIGARVGFGSPTAFRERFKRVVGISPTAYRLAFQSAAQPADGVRQSAGDR